MRTGKFIIAVGGLALACPGKSMWSSVRKCHPARWW